MNVPLMFYEGTGQTPPRLGLAHPSICPYGAFATRDQALILIAIQNEREWANFCRDFLREPDLPRQSGFETNTIRVSGRAMVDGHIAAVFATLTRAEAAARLRTATIAFGFVNDCAGLQAHPALRRVTVATPNGDVALAAPPAIFSDGPRALGPVPALGAHSAAIGEEFGAAQG